MRASELLAVVVMLGIVGLLWIVGIPSAFLWWAKQKRRR